MAKKFFLCKHCGNLVGMIESSGVPIICCGEPMVELVANTTDASQEKHVPVITISGTQVKVNVGSVSHPMGAEHKINWIYLETNQGGHRKALMVDSAPEATFALDLGEHAVAAFAYCNLHGLWMANA